MRFDSAFHINNVVFNTFLYLVVNCVYPSTNPYPMLWYLGTFLYLYTVSYSVMKITDKTNERKEKTNERKEKSNERKEKTNERKEKKLPKKERNKQKLDDKESVPPVQKKLTRREILEQSLIEQTEKL